jgi:hypothetical protein
MRDLNQDLKELSDKITQREGSKVFTTSKNESDTFLLTEETLDMVRYIASVDSITPNEVLINAIEYEFMRTVLRPDPTMSNSTPPEKE